MAQQFYSVHVIWFACASHVDELASGNVNITTECTLLQSVPYTGRDNLKLYLHVARFTIQITRKHLQMSTMKG